MNCPNCNSQITCGCQVRVATDGSKVCTNCVTFYEKTLADLKQANNTQITNNELPDQS
jgi:hypothetical protein